MKNGPKGRNTYSDGPPVTQLTDGVRQDESCEPEDGQQLETRSRSEESGSQIKQKDNKIKNRVKTKDGLTKMSKKEAW